MLSGCLSSGDPYSLIAGPCGELIPHSNTSLSQECKDALTELLPFDDVSFDAAPAGIKDKVLEAFQALAAYPLYVSPEQNSIFGLTISDRVGPISLLSFEILGIPTLTRPPQQKAEYQLLNRSMFNYVVNRTTRIYYQTTGTPGDALASYTITPDGGLGTLTITPSFWAPDQLYASPFRAPLRAAILLHEARHGDGNFHLPCWDSYGDGGFFCDADHNSPYGLQIAYLLGILRTGSRPLPDYRNGEPILDFFDQAFISAEICSVARFSINLQLPGLQRLIESGDCFEAPTANFLKPENLPALPIRPDSLASFASLKTRQDTLPQTIDPSTFLRVNDIARWLGKTPQELGLPFLRLQRR